MRRPWGTSPMPIRTVSYEERWVISWSRKKILPWRGGVKPTMDRISVVLPMPLRPSTATTVPSGTSREMPWST